MKTKIGLSLGLALTLVAGVFATMLALGLFSTQQVQASAAPGEAAAVNAFPTMVTDVTVTLGDTTVGATGVVATVTFATPTLLAALDTITIGFPAGVVSAAATGTDQVTVKVADAVVASTATTAGLKVTAELGGGIAKNATVTVAVKTIINPAATGAYGITVVTNKDTTAAPGTTTLTAVPPTDYVYDVSVVHAPTGVGEPAKVTVEFTTEKALTAASGTITIEFEDDVQMPAVLNESDITIVGGDTQKLNDKIRRVANPLDATVEFVGTPADEPRVTLTIPDMDPTDDGVSGIAAGVVTVIFRQSAGIKNPTEGGKWNVIVNTSEQTDVTTKNPDSDAVVTKQIPYAMSLDGDNSLTTLRTVSLSSASGSRGSTVTVTGRGFKNSTTATVWLEKGDLNNKQNAGEVQLCSAVVGGDDTFTCTFVANASNFTAGEKRTISAADGRNQPADTVATWELKGTVTAVPKVAAIGDTVTLQFYDFPSATLSRLRLGGVDLKYYTIPASGSLQITIPDDVALGKQSLAAIAGASGTRRTTLTITGAQVSVSPSTVVPNQSVTVTGRGFSSNLEISGRDITVDNVDTNQSSVLIGGIEVPWDKVEDNKIVEIDSGGSWVATVIIPVASPALTPGTYELKIIDSMGRPGITEITIPQRTVEFDPTESRVGTTVTVSGTGWIAANNTSGAENATIDVTYDAGAQEATSSATPDNSGSFSTTIRVPLGASIPSTNSVKVGFETPADTTISETVSHRVPEASIEITPNSGPGGTIAILSGGGFKAFTTLNELSISGVNTATRPASPNADRDGNLPGGLEVLIPALDTGTHTVRAEVGEAVVSAPFTITADDAPAAPVGDMAPADAFTSLGDSLVDVYKWIGATQEWQSFVSDPAFAAFNTLETVSSGDALWVRVTADGTYNGKPLYTGWNLVVLP